MTKPLGAPLIELEKSLNEELRQLAVDIITSLAIITPKLTGLATGNWQASINKPVSSVTSRLDLTGATVTAEESVVIDSAEKYKYPVIYISNLLDYIEDLNEGTSQQAPRKFINTAIEDAMRGG